MRAEQKKGVYTYGNFQKEKGLGTLGREYWKEPRRWPETLNWLSKPKISKRNWKDQFEPKSPTKTLERLPNGVANSASRENPPITLLDQGTARALTSLKIWFYS
jgi:hypothetical protein